MIVKFSLSFIILQILLHPLYNDNSTQQWFPINETKLSIDEELLFVQTKSDQDLSGIVLNVFINDNEYSCVSGSYKSNSKIIISVEQFNNRGKYISEKQKELVKANAWVPFYFKVKNYPHVKEADIIFSPNENISAEFQIKNFSYYNCDNDKPMDS
jgi:hypothetical protein